MQYNMRVTIHAPFPYTYRYLNLRFIKGCEMYLKLQTLIVILITLDVVNVGMLIVPLCVV